MFAVIRKDEPVIVLRTCSTKEAALIAAQLEKEKVDVAERGSITAVAMDQSLCINGGNVLLACPMVKDCGRCAFFEFYIHRN